MCRGSEARGVSVKGWKCVAASVEKMKTDSCEDAKQAFESRAWGSGLRGKSLGFWIEQLPHENLRQEHGMHIPPGPAIPCRKPTRSESRFHEDSRILLKHPASPTAAPPSRSAAAAASPSLATAASLQPSPTSTLIITRSTCVQSLLQAAGASSPQTESSVLTRAPSSSLVPRALLQDKPVSSTPLLSTAPGADRMARTVFTASSPAQDSSMSPPEQGS